MVCLDHNLREMVKLLSIKMLFAFEIIYTLFIYI